MNTLILILLLGRYLTVSQVQTVPVNYETVMQWNEAQNVALFSHDWLAGGMFKELEAGDSVRLIYDDGTTADYLVTGKAFYGVGFDNDDAYNNLFIEDELVLGTCINDGRLFIIAEKE